MASPAGVLMYESCNLWYSGCFEFMALDILFCPHEDHVVYPQDFDSNRSTFGYQDTCGW